MINSKQKIILEHAAFSAAAVAIAGSVGWVAAHGADLVGKKYEFYISAALIPALEYARKWFQTRAKETEVSPAATGDAPAAK